MGKKDIGLKSYLQDKERYADLWNGSVFQGRQVVRAEELQEITPVHSKADRNGTLERIGDLVMKQSYDGHRFAVLALENQQETDYGMPVRVMLQEALTYDKQMKENRRRNEKEYRAYCERKGMEEKIAAYRDSGEYLYKIKREDRLYPTATLVVYWGEEGWQGTRSLHEMIDFGMESTIMGQELRKLIPEYPLHILDLTRFNHTEYFRTELRPLFEIFQRRGNKEEFVRYVEENEKNWKMDDESWHVLSQLTDFQDLKYLIGKKNQKERKEKSMCKALEDLKKDARAEGKEEGKVEGKAEGKAEFIIELLEKYGTVPDRLKKKILEQKNLTVLNSWFKLALRIDSVDEFIV